MKRTEKKQFRKGDEFGKGKGGKQGGEKEEEVKTSPTTESRSLLTLSWFRFSW